MTEAVCMTRHFQPFLERKKQNQMSAKVAVISFTEKGSIVGKNLSSALIEKGYLCTCFAPEKFAVKFGFKSISREYIKWVEGIFKSYDLLLFISAIGIAIRGIAPYIKDKFTDPAVVVIDEKENFVIPLLSGHAGRAVKNKKIPYPGDFLFTNIIYSGFRQLQKHALSAGLRWVPL